MALAHVVIGGPFAFSTDDPCFLYQHVPVLSRSIESRHGDPIGDEATHWFVREVLPHEPVLRGFLRGRFRDIRDVDDVVQDVFLRLIQTRRRRPITYVRSLLFTIARNAALDLIRRQRKSPIVEVCLMTACRVPDEGRNTSEEVARTQEREILQEAIANLSPRMRRAIELTVYEGLPAREAGARMQITDSTVSQHVANAKKGCMAYFQELGLVSEHRR